MMTTRQNSNEEMTYESDNSRRSNNSVSDVPTETNDRKYEQKSRLVQRPKIDNELLRLILHPDIFKNKTNPILRLTWGNVRIDGTFNEVNSSLWKIKFLSMKTKFGEFMFCHDEKIL